MDGEDDDWFFDSVKNYQNLFMYNLQHAVTCMDWMDEKNLVVTTSTRDRNEIIELSVPDKLVVEDAEDAGLMKDRDFHQENGGFSSYKIHCMKHIPQSRQICTSSIGSSGVQIWTLGTSDSDLILLEKEFKTQSTAMKNLGDCFQIAVSESNPSHVVFGSCLENLCLVDVEAKTTIDQSQMNETKTTISKIQFLDENSILCCCAMSGKIVLVDLREKVHKDCSRNETKVISKIDTLTFPHWTMDATSDSVYRLSASGHIIVSDVRNGTDNVLKEVNTQLQCTVDHSGIQVQASPKHKDTISLSGFDGNIYVYDTQRTATENLGNFYTEPIFIHEGHVKNCDGQSETVKVLCHMWHPWKQDLIMSAADDGSLHAWEYHLHNS